MSRWEQIRKLDRLAIRVANALSRLHRRHRPEEAYEVLKRWQQVVERRFEAHANR